MSSFSSAGGHINGTNDNQCHQVSIGWDYPGATSWVEDVVINGTSIGTTQGAGSGSGRAIGNGFGNSGTVTIAWRNSSNVVFATESMAFSVGFNAPAAPSGTTVLTGSADQLTGVVSLSWSGTSAPFYALYMDGTLVKNVSGTSTTDTPPRGSHVYTVAPFDTNPCGRSADGPVSNSVSILYNTAPNAPILVTPPNNGAIDYTAAQRFTFTFNDNDVTDTQSAYDLRYRVVGSTTWTSLATVTTPNGYADLSAGTFAAGNYEWQVRTYDSIGAVGPYSASSFFTAAVSPGGPSITAPTNGSTIGLATATVTWSDAAQTSYQIRRVADNAGAPNTATVYFDSNEVVSVAGRTATVAFPTNSRYEHVQVRIKNSGLWSAWSSVRVLISYTPPAAPVILLTPDNGSILPLRPPSIKVTAAQPVPQGTQPPVNSMDIYRSEDGITTYRIAQGVPPGLSYIDYTVASGIDYFYQVRAFASNGVSSLSALTSALIHVNPDTYGGYDFGY